MLYGRIQAPVLKLTSFSGTMAVEDRTAGTGTHADASGTAMPSWSTIKTAIQQPFPTSRKA